MEKNLAILIADLSGYTALTETHGSGAAADLVEQYISMVNDSLAGDCRLHQCVGDEVLIVSSSADHLLATAIMLMKSASLEHHFLQLHGGLHYGKILERNNNYFGTTINLTSRIASNASPGSFCCSQAYIDSLSKEPKYTFISKGPKRFKNITDEVPIFELVISDPGQYHIDPVCRMVTNKEKGVPHPIVQNIFFCSTHCLDIYVMNEGN